MSAKKFVAEVRLSETLADTISRLARRLSVSESEVVTSSVKLMDAVAEGTLQVTPRSEERTVTREAERETAEAGRDGG